MDKILAIDDNHDNLVVLEELLAEEFPSARFLSALNGKDGLELAKKEMPSVVLLDLVMPEMDGFQVCKKFKEDAGLSHIPVIILTAAKTDAESRIKALRMGAEAFLSKPIDQPELAAQVSSMLRLSKSEARVRQEKDTLEGEVRRRTKALERQLQERIKAERNLRRSRQAALNLMEDLSVEIEQRKETEKALRESKENLSLIYDTVGDVIFQLSVEPENIFRFLSVNKRFLELTGLSEDQILWQRYDDVIPEPTQQLVLSKYLEAIREKKTVHWEETSKYPTGELTGLVSVAPFFDSNGKCKYLIGSVHDITERKRAEKLLSIRAHQQEVLAKLGQKALVSSNISPLFDDTVNMVAEALNVRFCKILELLPGKDALLLKAGVGWKEGIVGNATVGTDINSQAGYTLLSKEPVIVNDFNTEKRFSGPPLLFDHKIISGISVIIGGQKNPYGVIGAHTDKHYIFTDDDVHFLQSVANLLSETIERKQAEKALKESEERFRTAFRTSPDSININRFPDGLYVDINEGFTAITGYTREEIIGKTSVEIDIWVDYNERQKIIDGLKKFGRVENFEAKFRTKDGTIITGLMSATILVINGVRHILSVTRNIEDLKKAQEALQQSEAKWRSITENSPDYIMLLNKDAYILFINRTVPNLTKEEVVGKPVYNFIPSVYHQVARKCFEKVLQSGEQASYETEYVFKEGETKTFSVRVGPVFSEGKIVGLVSSSSDITQRKKIEERLKESNIRMRSLADRLQMIREEERARVAREIHDDLGQLLTAIKMDTAWLAKNSDISEEARGGKLTMMLELINSSIQSVKRIATELRPGLLDDLGLIPAIEWQAEEFQKRTNIKCDLKVGEKDIVLDEEISIAVFRIFQETLTNVTRHSGATKVDVSLNFTDDRLNMEIIDDGVGISEDQINSPKSLGLIGIRERINILNGDLEITGEYSKGTTVVISVPLSRS